MRGLELRHSSPPQFVRNICRIDHSHTPKSRHCIALQGPDRQWSCAFLLLTRPDFHEV